MDKTIVATEAARRFSELLSAVKFRAERYVILRGGKPVAAIGPVEGAPRGSTLAHLGALLRQLPPLGDEEPRFRRDLKKLRTAQPAPPRRPPWA
jgi:antitoxin (DNA-binding transcriptional repressor) of toxin-antitoxin stability system